MPSQPEDVGSKSNPSPSPPLPNASAAGGLPGPQLHRTPTPTALSPIMAWDLDHTKRWMKKYRTEIAASSSSLLSTTVAYPLDSVKTRMQAYHFPNFRECVRHTYRNEGLTGFWRGVWAPLASITLVRTVSFSIYQRSKYAYDKWITRAFGQSPLEIANTRGAWPNHITVMCFAAAGATSGAAITAIACPFELTKLSQQISHLMAKSGPSSLDDALRKGYQEKGTFKTARNIVRHRGFAGLYSGFHLHLLRDTLGTAIYFMTYESSKQILSNGRGSSPSSPMAVAVAGGLCGLVSWACIYPIDSAKSIYQKNCLTTGRKDRAFLPKLEYRNRSMYRGLGVSMARSAVLNAMFFSVFELTKKWIRRLEIHDDEHPPKPPRDTHHFP